MKREWVLNMVNEVKSTQYTRYISWSRWQNPMASSNEDEYVPEKDVKEFDNDPNDVFEEEQNQSLDGATPVILTPIGPVVIKKMPNKVFNFWLGESTFTLSGEITEILNDVPGVEILDIFTRYKFRIAVGNNFKFQEVRQAIELALDAIKEKIVSIPVVEDNNMILSEETKLKVQQIIQTQLAQHSLWAIYVCPNGKIDMTTSEEPTEEFTKKINMYVEARKLAGGAIFKNDEQLL